MMMGDWVGWSLPGEDGDHLGGGSPGTATERSLAWIGCWEKTLWPQQQGFGSNPKLLARTAQGWRWGGCQRTPPQAFREGTLHGSTDISLLSIFPPSHPKKSI